MEEKSNPSSAARPDLDWSQVRETMLMLNLAIAQLEMAMRDSGGSVEVLTNSFTAIYGNLMGMVEAANALPDSTEKQTIEELGGSTSGQMQHAIMAFQFYDRLSQRLTHVSNSLGELTSIVNDPSKLYNPFAWHALQDKIRSRYTMEEERVMFDTLLKTGDVKKALDEFVAARKQDEQNTGGGGDDIELF